MSPSIDALADAKETPIKGLSIDTYSPSLFEDCRILIRLDEIRTREEEIRLKKKEKRYKERILVLSDAGYCVRTLLRNSVSSTAMIASIPVMMNAMK
jgi:hypothetical protein